MYKLLFFLTISLPLTAQIKVLSLDGKNVLTKHELEQKRQEKALTLTKDKVVNMVMHKVEVRNDTTWCIYGYNIMDSKMAKKEERKGFNKLIDKPFPAFQFQTLDGSRITSLEIIGKPTLINLWYTGCRPCVEEIPILNNLKKKYEGKVNFMALTFNSKKEVEKFLEKRPYNFLHVVSADHFLKDLKVDGYPRNIFLDKEGLVKYVKYGIPYKRLENGELVITNGENFENFLYSLL